MENFNSRSSEKVNLTYDRLESVEVDINNIMNLAQKLQKSPYSDVESAEEAAKKFHNYLDSVKQDNPDILSTTMRVEGNGVWIANYETSSNEEGTIFQVEVKEGVGVPYGFAEIDATWNGDVNMVIGKNREDDSYGLNLQLSVSSDSISRGIELRHSEVTHPSLGIFIQPEIRINLNDSTSITIPELDDIRSRRAAIAEVSQKFNGEPVVKDIVNLDRAMNQSYPDKFIELKKTKILRSIGEKSLEYTQNIDSLMDAVSAVIGKDKPVIIGGKLYDQDNSMVEGMLNGKTVEVVSENPMANNAGASIIFSTEDKSGEKLIYAPLKDINSFRF